jgi:hypothetical protein
LVNDAARPGRRREWAEGPTDRAAGGWLELSDDELLFKIEALDPGHRMDECLLTIVQSDRHFFVRQEAAKKIRDPELLKAHSGDRHIGQILVRGMTRNEDVVYLEKLVRESRHLEVRKAAEAQLRALRRQSQRPGAG